MNELAIIAVISQTTSQCIKLIAKNITDSGFIRFDLMLFGFIML